MSQRFKVSIYFNDGSEELTTDVEKPPLFDNSWVHVMHSDRMASFSSSSVTEVTVEPYEKPDLEVPTGKLIVP